MNFEQFKEVLRQTFDEWSKDYIPREAGALAFFTIFSIAPAMVIALALGSLVMSRNELQSEILTWVRETINAQTATFLHNMLNSAADTQNNIATIVSAVFLVVAGTTLFYHLRKVMNKIWNVENDNHGLISNLRNRVVSLFFVIFLAVLLIIIVALNLILPPYVSSRYSDISWAVAAMQILGSAITFIIFSIIFAAAFKWLPSADIPWSDVRYGAILTAILFVIGQLLLYFYFAKADFASAYGAAGTIPVLLVWIFYTMFILLTGAEFTHVYSRMFGSRREQSYGLEDRVGESEHRGGEVTGSPAHQS